MEANHNFKVVVVGSSGVGKTSIVRNLVDGTFMEEGHSTIGVEFKTYSIKTEGEEVKLQIWDTAGQERFRSVSKAYFRGALGAVLVYDITSRESFDELSSWLTDLQALAVKNAYIILVGNKSDLADDRQIEESEAEEFANRYSLIRLETSAKTGDGVADAFARLGQGVLIAQKNETITASPDAQKIIAPEKKEDGKDKNKCC